MNLFLTDKEIKVWCRKEKSDEGEPITSMYLEEECLTFFGYWHNGDAKRLGLPFISRKDVKIRKYKKGVVPMTIVFRPGHDDMVVEPLELPKDLAGKIETGVKEVDDILEGGIPRDKIFQIWGRKG